jgi:hypothetical protein
MYDPKTRENLDVRTRIKNVLVRITTAVEVPLNLLLRKFHLANILKIMKLFSMLCINFPLSTHTERFTEGLWGDSVSNYIKRLPDILLLTLTQHIDEITGDHQCVYRPNRSTTDQIVAFLRHWRKNWSTMGRCISYL